MRSRLLCHAAAACLLAAAPASAEPIPRSAAPAGSVIARFRARGMAAAMLAAAVAHAIVGAIGFPQDTRTAPITIVFTLLWLSSAALFGKAAKEL